MGHDTRMLDLDFDQVLARLQGWVGQQTGVSVEATVQPLRVVSVSGTLAASREMVEPYDEDG
ncbi:MAG: hypothetical protein ACRDLT_12390 [Solirubrobacteraceae bacterium]